MKAVVEVGVKVLAVPLFFNPLLSVWTSNETLPVLFDIASQTNITDNSWKNLKINKVCKILWSFVSNIQTTVTVVIFFVFAL